MHAREGTAPALYRVAWYIVKCDTACWDVLLNCEAYMLELERGRVVGRSVAGVGGVRVLMERSQLPSASSHYSHLVNKVPV